MIASVLRLTRTDIKTLRITDSYSLHRVVYDLYDDIRTEAEKLASVPSGILYADKGGDWNYRQILMLSNRPPREPTYGQVESKIILDSFVLHDHYAFEVIINPTKRDKNTSRIIPICGHDSIASWFMNKSQQSWGFSVKSSSLQIQKVGIKTFEKANHLITHGSATIIGQLSVTDRVRFQQSFRQGIGRGRAFGFGLLQIVPLNPFKF